MPSSPPASVRAGSGRAGSVGGASPTAPGVAGGGRHGSSATGRGSVIRSRQRATSSTTSGRPDSAARRSAREMFVSASGESGP